MPLLPLKVALSNKLIIDTRRTICTGRGIICDCPVDTAIRQDREQRLGSRRKT